MIETSKLRFIHELKIKIIRIKVVFLQKFVTDMFFRLLLEIKMLITRFFVLFLIESFYRTALAGEKEILTSLRNNFRAAYPPNQNQYGVLYLHKGNMDSPPAYDVQGLCNYKAINRIKVAMERWARNAGTNAWIMQQDPPIWPTQSKLLQNECNSQHPNVATAGYNKVLPLNTGHSEYLLLNLAMQPMLESYIKNEPNKRCPDAIFLYSHESPCYRDAKMSSCVSVIRKTKENVINKRCAGTPFYVGYTSVYQGNQQGWEEGKMWLIMDGINVIQV